MANSVVVEMVKLVVGTNWLCSSLAKVIIKYAGEILKFYKCYTEVIVNKGGVKSGFVQLKVFWWLAFSRVGGLPVHGQALAGKCLLLQN